MIKLRTFNKQNGVALVELAIVLPLLLMLFYAFFAAIRLFATYNALGNISRVGTLWASSKIQICTSEESCESTTECRSGEHTSSYENGSEVTQKYDSCTNLAFTKMKEISKKYAEKLHLKKINFKIKVTKDEKEGFCFIETTTEADYNDPFFGGDNNNSTKKVNFGMGATFEEFRPTLSFTSRAYRCSGDECCQG